MAHLGLGRDDLRRLVFDDDFFTQNAGLAAQHAELLACRAAYQQSAEKSSCRCGGNPSVTFTCLDNLLARLSELTQTDPAVVADFIAYIGRKRNKQVKSITIYYRKTADTGLQKFKLP